MATVGPNLIARSDPNAEVFYPERDGKPMGETPVHREVMTDLIQGLQDFFEADPAIYVSGNMFLYFVEGNPGKNVCPDVMVVRGVDRDRPRPIFKTWEEGGRTPDLVIEVSSKSTRREDLREKMALYRDVLKVPEYILFDPLDEYLKPPLRGFRLVDGEYQPIPVENGQIRSQMLGLLFGADEERLRLYDGLTGELLLTRVERIQEKVASLVERDANLAEKDAIIAEKDAIIAEKDAIIAEQDANFRQFFAQNQLLIAKFLELTERVEKLEAGDKSG